MIILHFSKKREDIIEDTMASVMCYILVCKRKIFLIMLISSVIHVHY